jgi:hypothetical protein
MFTKHNGYYPYPFGMSVCDTKKGTKCPFFRVLLSVSGEVIISILCYLQNPFSLQ